MPAPRAYERPDELAGTGAAPPPTAIARLSPPLRVQPWPSDEGWGVGGLVGGGAFLFLGLFFVAVRRQTSRSAKNLARATIAARTCEVRRISLGFDWTARAALQVGLDGLAGKHDLNTARGMHLAAAETQRLLLQAIGAARYGMWTREHVTPAAAEEKLPRIALDLRARFTESTVRNDQRIDRPAMRPGNDGEGLVVISMVLGTTVHLPDPPATLCREKMALLLQQSLPRAADDLVALEVIWCPSDDSDRMSSRELEQFYPELRPLDDGEGLGGTSCGYCKAVYARELGRCPACGAPGD